MPKQLDDDGAMAFFESDVERCAFKMSDRVDIGSGFEELVEY